MTADSDASWVEMPSRVQRQLRVIALLRGAQRIGLSPLRLNRLHTMAYFADALAPVWNLRILEAHKLKKRRGPMSPLLQRDVDHLVGMGVVLVTEMSHNEDGEGNWYLDAEYELNHPVAALIVDAAIQFESQLAHFQFIEEVVFAVSALGLSGIDAVPSADAAYSDPTVSFGGLLNLNPWPRSETNLAARYAARFQALVSPGSDLTGSEQIQLYIRHLYQKVANVA